MLSDVVLIGAGPAQQHSVQSVCDPHSAHQHLSFHPGVCRPHAVHAGTEREHPRGERVNAFLYISIVHVGQT